MDTLGIQALTERVRGIPEHQPLYTHDNLLVLLLVCFFVLAAVLSDRKGFLGNMLKGFFLPREDAEEGNTLRYLYMRIGMLGVSFVSAALLLSVYLAGSGALTMIFLVLLLALYGVKQGLFWLVNWTFFGRQRAELWRNSYSNWAVLSAIPLYSCALFAILSDWGCITATRVSLVVLFLLEIGLLFRSSHIFLVKKYGGLHLFVYLCALELMPLLILGKALVLYVCVRD